MQKGTIDELLILIGDIPSCIIKEPTDEPIGTEDLILPDDLLRFYELCDGVILFNDSPSSIEIVSRRDFQRSNLIIVGELGEYDISFNWFIVGKGYNQQFISIDLAPERLGKCYDSFWDCHALVGESMIIARSFTELLTLLLNGSRDNQYWLSSGFKSFGDAYD